MTFSVHPRADLAPLTTFGVPATAARLLTLEHLSQLPDMLADPEFQASPRLILGGGSNLLFTRDYPGTVLRVALRGIRVLADDGEHMLVEAAAGENWHAFVRQTLELGALRMLVLDEADRLLEMGFWPDIQWLMKAMPEVRQQMLFSATLPVELESLASGLLQDPVRIEAEPLNSLVSDIEERLYLVNRSSKVPALIALLEAGEWPQVLVFISARDGADGVAKKLARAGMTVAALHGNKDQATREQALADFKEGRVRVLVATDLMARGIHVEALPVVINLDLPANAPVYVHRIGRTARAGQKGLALSLVCHGEAETLAAIRTLTGRALPLAELEGFPVTDQPASGEGKRAPRDKQANRRTQAKRSVKQFKGKA